MKKLSIVMALLAVAGCSARDTADGTTASAAVEELEAGGGEAPIEDTLGADDEAMISDAEVEALEDAPADEAEAAAAAEIDAFAPTHDAGVPAAPRCKKRIHVTWAVYTGFPALASNGCWVSERTVQDSSYRDCHADGSVKNRSGQYFFYDDTNPYNDRAREVRTIEACAHGERAGFEYMAFRAGSWRIVNAPHVNAYFAELYTDDAHIDDLYYAPGVYRGNHTLRHHKRIAPMLNFAPFPDTVSQRRIGIELLKVCRTVKNHGYFGLYGWHYPLRAGDARMKMLEHVLDRCTGK